GGAHARSRVQPGRYTLEHIGNDLVRFIDGVVLVVPMRWARATKQPTPGSTLSLQPRTDVERTYVCACAPLAGSNYSTISFLSPWTNATTSRCSASGTWNFASVAAACPRHTVQSFSLMRIPRWQSAMSLPR